MKQWLVTVLLLALVFVSGCGGGQVAVFFADPQLEAAVRQAIGEHERDILLSDVEDLACLEAPSAGISDLCGLEHWAALVELDLSQNEIVGIAQLGELLYLTRLDLQGNRIADIGPLIYLLRLVEIDLSHNRIADIQPLVNNPGVSLGDRLDLRGNPLNQASLQIHIPELEGRGVQVRYEG